MFRGKRSLGGGGGRREGEKGANLSERAPWERKREVVGLRRRGLCPGRDDCLSTDVQ